MFFGGTQVSASFLSSAKLTATTKPHPAGTVTVEVINPDGQKASINGFTFEAPAAPDLTSECSANRPEWIFCDDFESDRLSRYFEYASEGGSLGRAAGVGVNGSFGMRTRFAIGQVSAGNLKLAFGRTPDVYFRPVDSGTANYREVYWRVYLRMQPGWIGGGADKFSRATIFANGNWAQAAIAHAWSGTSPGPDQDYMVIDPSSGTDEAGNLKTTKYNDFDNFRWLGGARGVTPIFDANHIGQWYCIEVRMRLNDPGQSNGVFEMWIDGKLEAQRTGLNWVGSYQEYGINAIFLENHWNAGAPTSQERYMDNLVVSTQPIGCGEVTATPSAPVVSSISPTSGSVEGGTSVTINGDNFQPGASVSFGGSAASNVTLLSSTQLQAVTPPHAAGAVDVRVTNPDSQSGVLSAAFQYQQETLQAGPSLTGISPASGSTNGGTQVKISGTGFQSGISVYFGNLLASSVTLVSTTELQVLTPAAPAGAVDVRVINPDGQSAVLQGGFSFLSPESSQGILFKDDFETGDFSLYIDSAGNQLYSDPVHGGRFASRVKADVSGFGKLVARLAGPAEELWFRAWVYFPQGFAIPCCSQIQSGTAAGLHIWRYYSHFDGPSDLHFDFNIPSGSSGLQLALFSKLGPENVLGGNWAPASSENQGRWQCWETRVKLNTPGRNDGVLEFWADGQRRAVATGLNIRGSSSEPFRYVDVQSNIGGGPHPSEWPDNYWWGIDDVVVSTSQVGCGLPPS